MLVLLSQLCEVCVDRLPYGINYYAGKPICNFFQVFCNATTPFEEVDDNLSPVVKNVSLLIEMPMHKHFTSGLRTSVFRRVFKPVFWHNIHRNIFNYN